MAIRKKNRPDSRPKGPYYFPQGAVGQVDRSLLPTASIGYFEDVDITNPLDGDYLRYDGTSWVDVTVSQILTDLKTVDGAGSGLDADLLDTYEASAFLRKAETGAITLSGTYNFSFAPTFGGGLIVGGHSVNSPSFWCGDGNDYGFDRVVGQIFRWSDDSDLWFTAVGGTSFGAYDATAAKNLVLLTNDAGNEWVWEIGNADQVMNFRNTPTVAGADVALFSDIPTGAGNYAYVRRDGFTAMTGRPTIHWTVSAPLSLLLSDDAGNDETDALLTFDGLAMNDLTNVSDPGGAVAWNVLRHDGSGWVRSSAQTFLDHLESLGTMDATTVGGELPSAFADAIHDHTVSDITDFPTIYYQQVARNGFSAMTQRSTLRLIAGNQVTLDQNDDSINDETEITFNVNETGLDADTLDTYHGSSFLRPLDTSTISLLGDYSFTYAPLFPSGFVVGGHSVNSPSFWCGDSNDYGFDRVVGQIIRWSDDSDLWFTAVGGTSFGAYDATAAKNLVLLTKDTVNEWVYEIGNADQIVNFRNTPTVNGADVLVTGAAGPIADLTDVTITGPTTDDLLQWNGSAWVDVSKSEAGVVATDAASTINTANPVLYFQDTVDAAGAMVGPAWNNAAGTARWSMRMDGSNLMIYEHNGTPSAVVTFDLAYGRMEFHQRPTEDGYGAATLGVPTGEVLFSGDNVSFYDAAETWTAIQTHSVQDVFNAGIDFGGIAVINDSGSDLYLDVDNAFVINIDSDNTGTTATFQIAYNGTGTGGGTDAFVVEEAGLVWAGSSLNIGGAHSAPEFEITDIGSSDYEIDTGSGSLYLKALGSTTPTGDGIYIDDGGTNKAKVAGIKNITATATAPTGDYPYGTLHLIY